LKVCFEEAFEENITVHLHDFFLEGEGIKQMDYEEKYPTVIREREKCFLSFLFSFLSLFYLNGILFDRNS
jgi:hypothetical protein